MTQFVGLAGAPLIRELVESIKPCWKDSRYSGLLTILSALAFSLLLNFGIALAVHNSLTEAIGFGIATGLLSNVWNMLTDASKGK